MQLDTISFKNKSILIITIFSLRIMKYETNIDANIYVLWKVNGTIIVDLIFLIFPRHIYIPDLAENIQIYAHNKAIIETFTSRPDTFRDMSGRK